MTTPKMSSRKKKGDIIVLRIGSMRIKVTPEPEEKAHKFWQRIDKKMRNVSQKVRRVRGQASLSARKIFLPCSVLVGRTHKGA